MTNLDTLKYPIGKFNQPTSFTKKNITYWINVLKDFPKNIKHEVVDLSETELQQKYRQEGWSISQIVHHCADSHLNSFIRFKLALTEDSPVIKPYEEQLWAELADTKNLEIDVSLKMIEALHKRWTFLLENLTIEDWERTFIHPATNDLINLKTNLAIYAWHCNHHLAHIQNAKKNPF